jgi:uncharacterized DUF497 family protein
MRYYTWDNRKNAKLKAERGVTFEDVVFHIAQGQLLDIVEHPNQEKYIGQCIFIVEINKYAYLVPFVETEQEIFLKTIIPSRKATKRYLKGQQDE